MSSRYLPLIMGAMALGLTDSYGAEGRGLTRRTTNHRLLPNDAGERERIAAQYREERAARKASAHAKRYGRKDTPTTRDEE